MASTRFGAFTDESFETNVAVARSTVWQLMSVFVPDIDSQRTRFATVGRTVMVIELPAVAEVMCHPASVRAFVNADSIAAGEP
jgi:hypothetical protein